MPLYVKGTDTEILGTLETISGVALVSGFLPDGSPSYDGETKIWWDEQKTVRRDGKAVWLGEDGEEYSQDQIEERDE